MWPRAVLQVQFPKRPSNFPQLHRCHPLHRAEKGERGLISPNPNSSLSDEGECVLAMHHVVLSTYSPIFSPTTQPIHKHQLPKWRQQEQGVVDSWNVPRGRRLRTSKSNDTTLIFLGLQRLAPTRCTRLRNRTSSLGFLHVNAYRTSSVREERKKWWYSFQSTLGEGESLVFVGTACASTLTLMVSL